MKITSLETDQDQIVFLLLQPSVVRSLNEYTGYQSEVPENCKAVVACHVFREGTREDLGGTVLNTDLYIRGFAYCAGVDKFCVVKGMKIALEEAAKQFRQMNRPSPWAEVMKSRLRNVFIGDPEAVKKMNEDVQSRLEFNPYKPDEIRPTLTDWSKRKKLNHVKI